MTALYRGSRRINSVTYGRSTEAIQSANEDFSNARYLDREGSSVTQRISAYSEVENVLQKLHVQTNSLSPEHSCVCRVLPQLKRVFNENEDLTN